jgi:hypothetical protein
LLLRKRFFKSLNSLHEHKVQKKLGNIIIKYFWKIMLKYFAKTYNAVAWETLTFLKYELSDDIPHNFMLVKKPSLVFMGYLDDFFSQDQH